MQSPGKRLNVSVLLGHYLVFSSLDHSFLSVLGITQFIGIQRLTLLRQVLFHLLDERKMAFIHQNLPNRNVDKSLYS